MKKGIILKGIGGFYYVLKENSKIIECKPRGIFRKDNISPIVGDKVLITILDNGNGVIEEILPRKNKLIRPPVSNIDQGIIVFTLSNPEPNYQLIDRFLIKGEKQNISMIICVNKIDLINNASKQEKIKKRYENTGYPLIFTSTKTNIGLDLLLGHLDNNISVFAGPSGVGKSSILNKIDGDYNLEIGTISKRIRRGRHTTRHVELLPYGQKGFVVDTPGFSSLDMEDIREEELESLFPEFRKYLGKCKFKSCSHLHEPNCAIINALSKGYISKNRYNSYGHFLKEIRENKEF